MLRRRSESRVFFPWERRRGPLGILGRARARLIIAVVAAVAVLVMIRRREEHLAGVRATRATITTAIRAVSTYRADHAGACPRDVAELVTAGYARELPIDAWGSPLRVTCPGRHDTKGFDVSSDGPDGVPGGLDRVE